YLLTRVDVTSARYDVVQREQVRRYRFSYTEEGGVTMLSKAIVEGECPKTSNPLEDDHGLLADSGAPACSTWPALSFTYASASPIPQPSVVAIGTPLPNNYSVPTLVDINADALPDLVAPPAKTTDKSQSIALNSIGNTLNTWTPSTISFLSSKFGAIAQTMMPSNPAYNAGNFAGDG